MSIKQVAACNSEDKNVAEDNWQSRHASNSVNSQHTKSHICSAAFLYQTYLSDSTTSNPQTLAYPPTEIRVIIGTNIL